MHLRILGLWAHCPDVNVLSFVVVLQLCRSVRFRDYHFCSPRIPCPFQGWPTGASQIPNPQITPCVSACPGALVSDRGVCEAIGSLAVARAPTQQRLRYLVSVNSPLQGPLLLTRLLSLRLDTVPVAQCYSQVALSPRILATHLSLMTCILWTPVSGTSGSLQRRGLTKVVHCICHE